MNVVLASTPADWRAWLARNGRSEPEVWLVIHHSGSGVPSPRYREAIEHALCLRMDRQPGAQARPGRLAAPVHPPPPGRVRGAG